MWPNKHKSGGSKKLNKLNIALLETKYRNAEETDLGCGVMDLIDVAQDWDRLRAVVNAVKNLPVP